MKYLYLAGACLVVAQLLGLYGLLTHKADLLLSTLMIGLVIGAVALAFFGAYHHLAIG